MRPRIFEQFVRTEAAGGVVLLAAAVAALAAANSPWAGIYHAVWATPIVAGPHSHPLLLDARGWVNDALMAAFFLLVGLEIKRELLVGELASPRQAALPIAAALGGIAMPALLYLVAAPAGARGGWAIPTATDIAFALGILSLTAPRAPAGLKVFLAALAIADDMSAVVVIALVYTAQVHWAWLGIAAAVLATLGLLNRLRVHALAPYLLLGLVLWVAVHESGIHATVAGVLLAFTIPTRAPMDAREFADTARARLEEFDRTETGDLLVLTSPGQQHALHGLDDDSRAVLAPLVRLERALHGPSAFLIMPIFALANAGVTLGAGALDAGIAWAAALGLVLGKPLGITAAAWLACRSGLAALPAGVSWAQLHACAWIAGVGFTMSLFIAGLAFGTTRAFDAAQVGIMTGSLAAATIGAALLRRTVRD